MSTARARSKRTVRRYRGPAYWEKERPRQAQTAKLQFSYYPDAGKLQVQVLWRSREGELRGGKTVTLDQEDLALHPEARALLLEFLDACQ